MAITISIVEDEHSTRQALLKLLEGTSEVRCLSNYRTGEEALTGIPIEKPEIALVDINLPGMSGIECVAGLKAKMPYLRVLMLTTYDDGNVIFDSLRAGASGYLLKKAGYDELIGAIKELHEGGAPMSMRVARQVVNHFHQIQEPASETEKLSKREQEILTLLAKGYLNKEISDELKISMGTVSTHLQHIYEKLHVRSRTEAAAKFFGKA
jgi:DNA-binding NarL/FixJ family response regulator